MINDLTINTPHERSVTGKRKTLQSKITRKDGINRNRNGSVRKISGSVYVDFIYLGDRVRENAGLTWNKQNARTVRGQMDRISVAISEGTFNFAEVFPNSKKKDDFSAKERHLNGTKLTPDQVKVKDYIITWYDPRV